MVLRLSTVSKHLYTTRLYSTLCQRRMHVTTHGFLSSSSCTQEQDKEKQQGPVLLFDVMDTIVLDPFYTMMPDHFGLTFEQVCCVVFFLKKHREYYDV